MTLVITSEINDIKYKQKNNREKFSEKSIRIQNPSPHNNTDTIRYCGLFIEINHCDKGAMPVVTTPADNVYKKTSLEISSGHNPGNKNIENANNIVKVVDANKYNIDNLIAIGNEALFPSLYFLSISGISAFGTNTRIEKN